MKLLDKWINPVQSGLVGLDIGSSSVKAVSLSASGSTWTASCAAWAEIVPSDGEKAARHARTVEAIRSCLSQLPPQWGRYAVCGLSGPDAAVRGFAFPALPEDALEQAVRFEAQQVCPLDMHHAVIDYQLLMPAAGHPEASKTQRGVMVAATEQAVGERCRLVRDAGAKVVLMDADGLAGLNCLAMLEDLSLYRTAALIDVGWHYTNIILLGPNGLPFVRDINAGSQSLLAEAARQSSQDAEVLQKWMWGDGQVSVADEVLAAFHHAARPLVSNIGETLKYYASQEKCPYAEKVYLCGGGALVRPLAELLDDALTAEVTVFDPFAAIRFDDSIPGAELLKDRGPAFAAAAGLAMRTV